MSVWFTPKSYYSSLFSSCSLNDLRLIAFCDMVHGHCSKEVMCRFSVCKFNHVKGCKQQSFITTLNPLCVGLSKAPASGPWDPMHCVSIPELSVHGSRDLGFRV